MNLDCSLIAKDWIYHALDMIPDDIWGVYQDKIVIVCMDSSDGRRLTHSFCAGKEIIMLSERVVPRGPLCEDNPIVRYFWFVILHEIAHAICHHQSPAEITDDANNEQEQEANGLAFGWLNAYLAESGSPEFSEEEFAQSKARSQKIADSTFDNYKKLMARTPQC